MIFHHYLQDYLLSGKNQSSNLWWLIVGLNGVNSRGSVPCMHWFHLTNHYVASRDPCLYVGHSVKVYVKPGLWTGLWTGPWTGLFPRAAQ